MHRIPGLGAALVGRFVYHWLVNPDYSGFVQSLTIGVGCIVLAFLMGIVALLSELLAANRRLLEETLRRVRRLERGLSSADWDVTEYQRTGAEPWKGGEAP